MAKQLEGVSERILNCAKAEILDKGYTDASLRAIAAAADTSTNSIYVRFGDKEGLFSAIVDPALNEMTERFLKIQEKFHRMDSTAQAAHMAEYADGGTMELVDYMYDHLDEFRLLLDASYGTRFHNFIDELVRIEVEYTYKYMETVGYPTHLGDTLTEKHDIVFDRVSFSYEQKTILHDISVTLPDKTTTAIIGPSGSGKTTFCNLVARFWDVDSGSVSIGGRDVRDYTLEALMNQISMVFQNVYLFADTIENNIKFGCPNATHEQVVEAARKAGCDDFIEALPDGYDTVIGEGGASLSGGEKQRISIARAMLKDAPIIILDEATANVDPENEDRLQKAIEALTRDKTIIMIAHRLKTVRNADQILVLDDGRIVQQGKHSELISQPGIYADFVGGKRETSGWKL